MPPYSFPTPEFIRLDLQGKDLEAVLRELYEPIRTSAGLSNVEQAWADLIARQAAGPVAIDHDVALPHARTAGVNRIVLSAGRHRTGVAFDQTHQSVRLIFLILTPKERAAEYLQLVATLARRLRDQAVRSRLLTTENTSDFSEVLKG